MEKKEKCMFEDFFIFYLCMLSCITKVNAMHVTMSGVEEGDLWEQKKKKNMHGMLFKCMIWNLYYKIRRKKNAPLCPSKVGLNGWQFLMSRP